MVAMLLTETDWSYSHEQDLLAQDMDEISLKARTTEFKKMNKALEKQIELELADPVALELSRPDDNMWHKIIEIYNTTVSDGEKLLAKNAKSKDYILSCVQSANLSCFRFRFF